MNNINNLYNTLLNNKGLTLNKDLTIFNGSGYAVALPNKETKIQESDLDLSKFTSLLQAYRSDISGNQKIGLWIDQGLLYIDISEVLDNKDQALSLAKNRSQLAIFDFNELKSIYL